MRKKVNTVVVSTDVVIPPDQLKRKCLRSTHYWRDIIIVLMKKCSLAYKKLKTFLFDGMRIEYTFIYKLLVPLTPFIIT